MKKTTTKKTTRVPKTRNGGKYTESQFWGMIRAALRDRTRFWIPKLNALLAARRPSQSNNKKLKWEFLCKDCLQYFPQKSVEMHHEQEAGSLRCAADLPLFVEKLFSETGWICLCLECHKKRHNNI